MKLKNLYLIAALVMSVVAVGCGKNNDANNDLNQNVNPGIQTTVIPNTPIPPGQNNPGQGQLPRGCYPNGTSQCAPCPAGYVDNGSVCVFNGAVNSCQYGTFWNGFYCQPVGQYYPNCPWPNTVWSNYYMACISTQPPNCSYKTYLNGMITTYVCR